MGKTGEDNNIRVSADGVHIRKRFAGDMFPVPVIAFEISSGRDEAVRLRLSDRVPDGVDVEDLGFHPDYGSEYWTIEEDRITFEKLLEPDASYTTVYGVRAADDVGQFLTEPTIEEVDPPLSSNYSNENNNIRVSADGVRIRKRFAADRFPVPAIEFEISSGRDQQVSLTLSDRVPDGVDVDDLGFHPDYGSEHWTIEEDRITFERDLEQNESYTTVYGIRAADDVGQFLTEPTIEEVDPPLSSNGSNTEPTPVESPEPRVTSNSPSAASNSPARTQQQSVADDQKSARATLECQLDDIDTRLSSAETDDEFEKALATLDVVEAAIADAGESDRLQDRCDRLRERAERRLEATTAPEAIPTAPRLSLAYDNIKKGDPIGSGGNADVYYATATTDSGEIELALKEPRMSGGETLHTETVERMMDEAETWQQLDDHDHIVSVLGYGSEPLPWIAMEYMDSGHLGERAGDLPFDQALWTALATTEAVRHAHDRGVAHLDLKPANILFRSVEGAWDVPKVADWGLSKHLLEHSNSVDGMSPQYAAPEQFDTDQYGPTDNVTDVYQLGAVFYELFTGRPHFEGQTFEVINRIQSEQPAPPSEVADVPEALDEVLLRALATEKADRYEHVLYLRDALQALHDDL